MNYVLILTIVHSFGAVDVQRQDGFGTYRECVEHGVGWAESQRPLYPDSTLRWHCERGDE
jgi:hypothetical protein